MIEKSNGLFDDINQISWAFILQISIFYFIKKYVLFFNITILNKDKEDNLN